jgi:ketosteroid isomerase-like protein
MNARHEQLESQLNEMTAKGQILEALDAFYAEDCCFEEGDGSRRESRQAQHAHLSAFFATLERFNGATLHAQSVGDGVSMSEWTFDMTSRNGEPIVWNEVLVRRWKDGKVRSERFYQAG